MEDWIDILEEQWSYCLLIEKILLSINSFSKWPNPEIINAYKKNREKFNSFVKEIM